MHSTESRRVIGPSHILFSAVSVCTNWPGYCTGWGSEGHGAKGLSITE